MVKREFQRVLSQRRRVLWLLCAAWCLVATTGAVEAQESQWRLLRERWYTIEINGERAGWASESLFDDGARYKLATEQTISVARGESDVATVSLSIESIETHEGAPVEISQMRRLGSAPEHMRWVWGPQGVERLTREIGGERRVPETFDPGASAWLMPYAAEKLERARRADGVEDFEYRAIDTSAGLRLIAVHLQKKGDSDLRVGSDAASPEVWTMLKSTLEGAILSETTLHISAAANEVVLAEETTGGMRFTVRSATKGEAQRAIASAPEVLGQTVVRPNVRIPRAQATVSAVYRLRARHGDLPLLPTAGAQRTEAADDGSMILTIDVRAPAAASPEESANAHLLEESAVVNSDDPAVVALASEVVSRLTNADGNTKAEALRRAVFRHISRKGLSSAFATAAETVRSRSGDCTEHAVLLCALLRAEGIPARVASGLVYAESFAGERHVFAWHMWTQALIEGAWIDLDATTQGDFSAAHILAGTTDLSNGALGDEITRLVGLMGNLDIEVISIEHR